MTDGELPPDEEQLREAYEQELKRIRVEQILLEQVVSLINMGMRRTGLAPGTEDERDLGQVRVAIEGVRALTPLIEQTTPGQAPAIRDALSQLQLAFVRLGGATGSPGPEGQAPAGGREEPPDAGSAPPPAAGADQPPDEEIKPGEPGPAERSGRLWVPGH